MADRCVEAYRQRTQLRRGADMPARIRTHLATPIALLALVIACSGSAVAAGLAKDSVTSRSIKNNAVKSLDVKDGALTSADIQDGALTSADIQDGTLGSADVRDDGLTGADIGESTLGTVPNATAVGGVQVSPLVLSLPSDADPVPVLNESGSGMSLGCGTTTVFFNFSRAPGGAPMAVTSIAVPNTVVVNSMSPGSTVASNLADGQVTATIVLPGGGSVTAAFTAIYEVNAAGANDCFYRGTITRIP
jgi:hypothetical protein